MRKTFPAKANRVISPLTKSLLGNKGDTDLQHPQILARDMSFGACYHCLHPSFKLLSNNLGPGRSLVLIDSWANGYKHLGARYLLPAWPPCWEPLILFAEVICRKKVRSTHCWEPYKMLFSAPHLADGSSPPTVFNLVHIGFCTVDLLHLCRREKLEDGNFLNCRHFSQEMPFSCICSQGNLVILS